MQHTLSKTISEGINLIFHVIICFVVVHDPVCHQLHFIRIGSIEGGEELTI